MTTPPSSPTPSQQPSNADSLPVLADGARPYIQIRPTTDNVDPWDLPRHLKRLHRLCFDESYRRWLPFDSPDHTTIEVLLYTGGRGSITYQFGCSDPEKLDALEGILREVFPNSYEFQRVEFHPDSLTASNPQSTAGIEFEGRPKSRQDWQTRLTPYTDFYGPENQYTKSGSNSHTRDQSHSKTIPLATIAETMANSEIPVLYQALLTPYHDFTSERDAYIRAIETGDVGLLDQVINALAGYADPAEIRLTPADESRLDDLATKDVRHSFILNARAVAISAEQLQSADLIRTLESAFADISGDTYRLGDDSSTGKQAQTVFDRLQSRTIQQPTDTSLKSRLPGTSNGSPGIVADPAELGSFCLLDGNALTTEGKRALDPTPQGRTGIALPPQRVLETYQQSGFEIGLPLTADKQPIDTPVALPPSLQPMHQAILGATGSGKTYLTLSGVLSNHTSAEGPSVLILPKGGSAVTQYLLAHYDLFGGLDDVVYFDCSDIVPALSFFDIRDQLEAGIPRTTAVQDVVGHYVELLNQIMGKERYDRAVRSPDVIEYVIQALFDPVHGSDAFSHRDLHYEMKAMQRGERMPTVSDEDLTRTLGDKFDADERTFEKIMSGVASRIEKITTDPRLASMFNHVAGEERTAAATESETGDDPDGDELEEIPHFDLSDYLDSNTTIVIDTGGIRPDAQRAIALAIVSNAWTALKRRKRSTNPGEEKPLINLYIEEAASIANASLLEELLAQGREFDVSVTLAMQFPSQLASADASAADELLNNVQTIVSGSVPADFELAKRLATGEHDAQAIADRLDGLRRGEWFVRLPGEFLAEPPQPFYCQSLPLPPGHPDGPRPLTEEVQTRFEQARTDLKAETARTVGLELTDPATTEKDNGETESESEKPKRVDSAFPHTTRLPKMVSYDETDHVIECTDCETRYSPDDTGLEQAIECCHSRSEVDPDDIPITDVNLRLDETERRQSEWSDQALMFLQVVHNASQLMYEAPGYDLLSDSMIRLQEYVGVESTEVEELIDAGLLSQDTTRPHRLYSLRPEGRKLIGQENRHGVHYGHGKGDLDESSQHVLGVVVTKQRLEQAYCENPESSVVEVLPYYELREGSIPVAGFMGGDSDATEASSNFEQHRLDLVGLDGDGEIVVVCEIERVNHDLRRAAPSDYDKMAACDPEEAIWVAMSHSEAHEILQALNDPLEGDQRVAKTYSESSPVQKFKIDEPGLTQMHTLEQLLSKVREE